SWTNVTVPVLPQNITLLDLQSALNPFLSAGSAYWFTATSAGATDNPTYGIAWDINNQAVPGGLWETDTSPVIQSDTIDPQVAIQVDSVPEPATGGLVGCAVLGLAWRRRK